MKLLPVSVAESEEDITSADIDELCLFYKDDLPAASSIGTELHCWSVKWKGKIDEARGIDTPLKALGTTDRDFFPNIRQNFLLHQPFLLEVQSVSDLSVDCDT